MVVTDDDFDYKKMKRDNKFKYNKRNIVNIIA